MKGAKFDPADDTTWQRRIADVGAGEYRGGMLYHLARASPELVVATANLGLKLFEKHGAVSCTVETASQKTTSGKCARALCLPCSLWRLQRYSAH